MAGQLLDRRHREPVLRHGDGEGMSLQPGAAGAANAVDVILGVVRHVEIEHMRQPADVQTARRDIAAHQQPQLARLEFLQRGETDRLRHVAMQRARVELMPHQRFMQNVHIAFAVAENQRVLHVLGADQTAQRLALVVLGDQGQPLGDARRHAGGPRDGDLLGVLQERVGEPFDFRPHRGGEEQRLPGGGQQRDDPLNIRDEAHVEHPVRLVDHQHAGIGQQDQATLEHIEQTARRRDQHIDAAVEHFLLIGHALAADDEGVGQFQVFAVLNKVLRHLQREFARRLQDQAARHPRPRPRAAENVEHRQGEPRRLAGAGLRYPHHVPRHQDDGDRLFLDRRRMHITHVGDGAQHGFRQAEISEGGAGGRRLLGSQMRRVGRVVGCLVAVVVIVVPVAPVRVIAIRVIFVRGHPLPGNLFLGHLFLGHLFLGHPLLGGGIVRIVTVPVAVIARGPIRVGGQRGGGHRQGGMRRRLHGERRGRNGHRGLGHQRARRRGFRGVMRRRGGGEDIRNHYGGGRCALHGLRHRLPCPGLCWPGQNRFLLHLGGISVSQIGSSRCDGRGPDHGNRLHGATSRARQPGTPPVSEEGKRKSRAYGILASLA